MTTDRTPEQIRHHYEVEKGLADRLRKATKEERRTLYAELYDELYRQVPDHPQLTRKASSQAREQAVSRQLAFLERFLVKDGTFLEVGPGDCSLSAAVALQVRSVVAVDVSDEITRQSHLPGNLKLVLSDGTSVPVPESSIDVAYSNQLMEHLHSDDAREQLENLFRALKPGGAYVCVTPNRLTGPHDVSVHFDEVATGFHMREYTSSELASLFRSVGFSAVEVYVGGKGHFVRAPLGLVAMWERSLSALPPRLRRRMAGAFPIRALLNGRVVGRK